jgi:hypothetical protein
MHWQSTKGELQEFKAVQMSLMKKHVRGSHAFMRHFGRQAYLAFDFLYSFCNKCRISLGAAKRV